MAGIDSTTEVLTKAEATVAEAIAGLGKEAKRECAVWFSMLTDRVLEINARFDRAKFELAAKGGPIQEEMAALNKEHRERLHSEIEIFHGLVDESIMRASGVKEGVQ